jgi:hypothetical protein
MNKIQITIEEIGNNKFSVTSEDENFLTSVTTSKPMAEVTNIIRLAGWIRGKKGRKALSKPQPIVEGN